MWSHKIGATWVVLLVFAGMAVSGALSFVAGFNFHGIRGENYTAGFRGSRFFVGDLVEAYIAYRGRKYQLEDPAKVRDLLDSVSSVRVGVYRPWRGYPLPVLSALRNVGLTVGTVSAGTPVDAVLKSYDVLIFPQGSYTKRELPGGEVDRIRMMVKGGVGYIGICAGTVFAKQELGIVDAELVPRVSLGLMRGSVSPVASWGQYASRNLMMFFANGGYFATDHLNGWEPLILSRNLGVVAIRGKYGRGNVVLFTVHPEGGGITLNNQTVYASGRDLETGGLLLQAILMARPTESGESGMLWSRRR